MPSTDIAELKKFMAENTCAVIEDVARERKVSPRAVRTPAGCSRRIVWAWVIGG